MTLFGNKPYTLKKAPAFLGECAGSPLNAKFADGLIENAHEALKYELEPLKASAYMHYFKTGNRKFFEDKYHCRRARLSDLFFGAVYEGVEKYVDKMVDIIWAICEETTWVIPPHSVSKKYELGKTPLPDMFGDDVVEVDLFSAATGALVSMVWHYFGSELDAATGGVLSKRVEHEIDRRVITPFLKYEMRWMYSFINNWVPWIVSNVLTCAAVFVNDMRPTLQTVVSRSITFLERFIATYGDDCGCNEGVSYWNAAVGALFDACEELYDLSGGDIDFAGSEFMRRAGRFVPDMCIDPETRLFVNFADCPPYVRSISGEQMCRMGMKTKDDALISFGKAISGDETAQLSGRSSYFFIYRAVKNLYQTMPKEAGAPFSQNAVYGDLNIAVLRAGKFVAVLKGGHNGESHNHNDVGHFVLYRDGEPIIIDSGNLEYTRDTFNENRYKIWTNQSSYHNLPDIGGVMQHEGREFCADGFLCEGNTAFVSYGKAYPVPAVCERKIELCEGGLTVYDSVTADADVTFRFMTKEKPEIKGGAVFLKNVKMSFSENGGVSFDAIDVSSSPAMTKTWGQSELYRVNVKAKTLKTVIEKI